MTGSRKERRDTAVAMIVCAAASIALFAYMFGLDLPLARAAFWSMPRGDMAVMTAGYEVLLHAPWNLAHPAVTDHLVGAPMSIVFTDSIPWMSLLLKASGLGELFNPLGLFLLIAYVMQGVSMILLLRAMGVRGFVPLLAGGLLSLLTPAWTVRQFGHIALAGHFVLILMLALTVTVARRGLTPWRIAGFCVLGALVVGVHAYHLVPFAFCLGAALIATLLHGGWKALPSVLLTGVACCCAIALAALFLGYGVGRGASGGEGALGFYSMNLISPIEPQGSALFGEDWNGRWFKKTYDPTGGQAFEGYNYLGFGVLIAGAIALAFLALAWLRGERPSREQWLRFLPIGLMALGLTIAAVGPIVYAHMTLVAIFPKPTGRVAEWIGLFRSHGRFFWTVAYLVMALAICVLSKRLSGRTFAGLAVLVLAIQVYDTTPPRHGLREIFDKPVSTVWPSAISTAPALRDRQWVFNPTYFCQTDASDMTALSQLTLVAGRNGGRFNSAATARPTPQECGYPAELLRDAAPGDRRITVIFNAGIEDGGRLEAFSGRNDCRLFERGALCGRDLEATGLPLVAGRAFVAPKRVFTEVRFDTDAKSSALREGWAAYDPGGKAVWSNAHRTLLELPTPKDLEPGGPVNVDLVLYGFSDPPLRPQRVTVSLGGRVLKDIKVEEGIFEPYRIHIPGGLVKPGQPVVLQFDLPDARVSANDPRMLGVAIQSAKIFY
jgi:hypothetical protein